MRRLDGGILHIAFGEDDPRLPAFRDAVARLTRGLPPAKAAA